MVRTCPIRLAPTFVPVVAAFILGAAAQAGEVDVPHVFVAGDKARASQVNENFSALEAAVDDNAADIAALESADSAMSSALSANTAEVAALASSGAGMQADIDANAASIGALRSADGSLQGQIDSNSADIATLATMTGPIVFSSPDLDTGGTTVNGDQEMNSLMISLPMDGFLVVSGQVFVNNQDPTRGFWVDVSPMLDGTSAVSPAPFASRMYFPGNNVANDQGTVSFTVSFAVPAGMHVLSMAVRPTNDGLRYFYNSNFLTATFFPGAVSPALAMPQPAMSAPEDPSIDVYGNPIDSDE